jgi:hypothetical protein
MKNTNNYSCDYCGREGTYDEVGRGSVAIFGAEIETKYMLKEICNRCVLAIIKLVAKEK